MQAQVPVHLRGLSTAQIVLYERLEREVEVRLNGRGLRTARALERRGLAEVEVIYRQNQDHTMLVVVRMPFGSVVDSKSQRH